VCPRRHKSLRLREKRRELLNQNFDEVRELMERWNERLTLGSLKLSQRFESGQLRILLPFRHIQSGKRGIIVFEPVVPVESLTFTENITAARYQSSVFVDVVKFVKSPKCVIPTFIRLEGVDELDSSWFNQALYFSTSAGFISMEVFANRERNVSQIFPASFRVADQGEMVDHVVERAPKIVQNIASDRKHFETNDWKFSKLRRELGNFRVILRDTDMSVGVPIRLRSSFEFNEVLFGPFNLYPHKDKSFFCAQRHGVNSNS
jgi:hypothetical protein